MAPSKRTQTRQVRVYAYCRYSSESGDNGYSIETQRAALKGICAAEGLALTGFIVDRATSGGKPLAERENGGRMLRRLRRGDVVVALKLDRAFRSAADCLNVAADLNKRGVRLYLHDLGGWIAGTPEAEFRLTIFAGVAQFERKCCQQRILEAKEYLRSLNRFEGGSVPFGFRAIPSDTGELTKLGSPVRYLEPDEKVHSVALDLLAKGYSSRLAAGHFAQHGQRVTHHAVNALFQKLRSATI